MKRLKQRSYWLSVLLTIVGCVCGCNKNKALEGTWLLDEFCFGADCSKMADHGIEQTWVLSGEPFIDSTERFKGIDMYIGHQFHAEVMDQDILWHTSAENDTLFITNKQGTINDLHLIKTLDKDTLVLTSTLNDTPINQRFIRK